MVRDKTQNTNLASEYYVASQLLRLGYDVDITLGHRKEIDLLVFHPDRRMVTVDVKGLKNKTNFPLQAKRKAKNHFYVLVSYLNRFDNLYLQPDVFIIPSLEINKVWNIGDKTIPCVRYKNVKKSKYKNAWHLLFKERK